MSGSGAGAVAGAVGASRNLILGSVYTRFYFIHVAATKSFRRLRSSNRGVAQSSVTPSRYFFETDL